MTLSNEEIVELIEDYEKESKAIKKNLIQQCWYMRGGMTLDEAFQLGFQERSLINDLIKENLEVTKTTKLPFF